MITSAFSLAFNGSALLSNQNEMRWDRNIYQVTTATNGNGSITATPNSGFAGTTVSLANTPNAGYTFNGYSITGAELVDNQFTLVNSDVTAMANFYKEQVRINVSGAFGDGTQPLPLSPTTDMPYVINENMGYSARLSGYLFDVESGVDSIVNTVPIITAFNGPLTLASIREHSSYYQRFENDEPFSTGYGLKKPVHITRVFLGTSSYNIKTRDTSFGAYSNGPWYTGTITPTSYGPYYNEYQDDMDFVVSSNLYINSKIIDRNDINYRYTGYFTGYILV